MRWCNVCVVACGVVVVSASVGRANLLVNGNFDQSYAQLVVPATNFYAPKPTGWSNEGTRSITGAYEGELSLEPWAGPAPTPVTTDGNGLPNPDGYNGLDGGVFFKPFTGNPTDGSATGHLYQHVAVTPGVKYTLTGWAGAEANAMMSGAEIALEFYDGVGPIPTALHVLDLLPTLKTANGEPFAYKEYMVMGVAPVDAVSVRVRVSMIDAMSNPAGGGQAFVVDDFVLLAESVVPEPTSVALLGAAGALALRRRRRRSVA